MEQHYVYGYRYDGEWIYIGHGKGHRKMQHLCQCYLSQDKPFYKKLKELIDNGDTPDIVVLHEGLSKEEAKQKEFGLITQIGLVSEGGSLLNIWKRDGPFGGEANPMLGRFGEAHNRTKLVIATNLQTGETFTINGGRLEMTKLGFTNSAVSACCLGKRKSHKGHTFKFKGNCNE